MKSLKTIGLCIGLVACLSLFGCSADSDENKVATQTNTEQETKAGVANNPHIPAQARAGIIQNMDRAKAGALAGAKDAPK